MKYELIERTRADGEVVIGKGNINSLKELLNRYADAFSKFKVRKSYSLFEVRPDFEAIRAGNCGFCGKKLKVLKSGRGAYCGRKKCPAKPAFFIRMGKLNEMR